MPDLIVAADKGLRVKLLAVSVLLIGVGLLLLWLLEGRLEEVRQLAGRDLEAAVGHAVQLTAVVASTCGLGFMSVGLWMGWLGWQIRRSGQFPPPGMKVVKDTPVRVGKRARRLANLALVNAVALGLGGPLASWYFYRWAIELMGV